MPREHANLRIDIWGDDDWRDLSRNAQWLYELLLTHSTLTNAGVADWRPPKLAGLAKDATVETVRAAADELAARYFVIYDDDTEEILVRSYLRHDGVLRRPNVAIAMTKAFAAIASSEIRGVIVHELRRLEDEYPEWPAFKLEAVRSLLKRRSIDPKRDRSADGSGNPSDNGSGNGFTNGSEFDPSLHQPQQLHQQEASLLDIAGEAKLKETRLPKSWAPTQAHFELARARGVDIAAEVEAFRLHAETHDRHAARWNAAFTTWLKKSRPRPEVAAVEPGQEWMLR